MAAVLASNHHGKGRVRVTKVIRRGPVHSVLQFNVEILLEGPTDAAFTAADNSLIIPTDTQKNTVYVLAKTTSFDCAEEFAVIVARHFLATYPDLVHRCRVMVKEDTWRRVQTADSTGKIREHDHAFLKGGPHYMFGRSEGTRQPCGRISIRAFGGVKGLTLFKTTQSSFTDFHKDNNTSLPEAEDSRLLGTCMDGEWEYDVLRSPNFSGDRARIIDILVEQFAGPADKGVHSPSVQVTCFQMGSAVLAAVPSVSECTFYMPNVHNLPFDLAKYGLVNADQTGLPHIFYPVDEPHGIIQATIKRPSSKL
ncbi:unnamed protein product [Ectocarpus fasciculatus]